MQPQWVWAGKAFSGGLVKEWWEKGSGSLSLENIRPLNFTTYSQAHHDTLKRKWTHHWMTIYKPCETAILFSALTQRPQQWSSTLQQSCSSSGLASSLCTQLKVSLQPEKKTGIAPHCTCGLMSKIHCHRQLIYKIKLTRNPDKNCKNSSFIRDFIWCPTK